MQAHRRSIQHHLLVSVTCTIILLYSCSSIAIYWLMRREFYEQMDQHLAVIAEDFIAETERSIDGSIDSEFHGLGLEGFQIKDGTSRSFYQLWDHHGEVLLRSPSLSEGNDLPFTEVESNAERHAISFSFSDGRKGRMVIVPFQLRIKDYQPEDLARLTAEERKFVADYNENAPENLLYLATGEDSSKVRETLFILSFTLLLTGLTLGVASFFLLRTIVRAVCRPIIRIAEMTEDLGPDNLDIRLPPAEVQEELRPVIVKFNQFIERLNEAIQRERRFSIDIAHELRTPVAEMRSLMEVASENAPVDESSDPMEDPATIYQLGATISQRMSKIIEIISAIHQVGDVNSDIEKEKIGIASVLQSTLDILGKEERDRIKPEAPESGGILVATDPMILRAILDNLIMNAIAHSPENSPIIISINRDGIEVENEALDLREDDLARIVEPFWQKDAARTDPDRFGLGLTLVAAYARLLGARVTYHLKNQRFHARLTGLEEIQ